jgi:hypothetical protein
MTTHRSIRSAPETLALPPVEIRLVCTVTLTGRYNSASEVVGDLERQVRRRQDCHTAVVRLGEDALRHMSGLPEAIAGAFYLGTECIQIEAPAGRWEGPFLYGEVTRHVRQYRAYHEQMIADSAQSSG